MSEAVSVPRLTLSAGQLHLIARKYGVFAGRALADVGCGHGDWLRKLRQRGCMVTGMEEPPLAPEAGNDAVTIGTPSATVPWGSHTLDCVLLRGTRARDVQPTSPEGMIALANLGASLKPKGRLLIPVTDAGAAEIGFWQDQFRAFPGTVRVRTLTSGLRAYLTLGFLFGFNYRVVLVEYRAPRQQISRLEWHRLARAAYLSRIQPPAAA